MHGPGLLLFALEGLEIIQVAFARDLALELFHPIERHPCGIGPVDGVSWKTERGGCGEEMRTRRSQRPRLFVKGSIPLY